jgi:hypothetical protein
VARNRFIHTTGWHDEDDGTGDQVFPSHASVRASVLICTSTPAANTPAGLFMNEHKISTYVMCHSGVSIPGRVLPAKLPANVPDKVPANVCAVLVELVLVGTNVLKCTCARSTCWNQPA